MSGLLGAVCIILACGGLGSLAARRLRERREHLAGAAQGMNILLREIDYGHTPLPQALRSAAQGGGSAAPLFARTAELLEQSSGCPPDEAWAQALAASSGLWQPADQPALAGLGFGLGQQDAALQLRQVELTRLRIEEREKVAAAEQARFGKLWNSLGWMGGVVLALLLL